MPNVPSLLQLHPEEATRYVEQMLEASPPFILLYNKFREEGFQFFLQRAQVFAYLPLEEAGSDSFSSNILGILPSFVSAKREDDYHVAIGIAVHNYGGAVATRVKVMHNPFRVSEFTLHEVSRDLQEVTSRTVTTHELSSQSIEEVAERLGRPPITPNVAAAVLDRNTQPPSLGQAQTMLEIAFQRILHDQFARPLYPPSGLRSLEEQIPLIQKYAAVHALRYSMSPKIFGICSSTCCNGCTTSSIIVY